MNSIESAKGQLSDLLGNFRLNASGIELARELQISILLSQEYLTLSEYLDLEIRWLSQEGWTPEFLIRRFHDVGLNFESSGYSSFWDFVEAQFLLIKLNHGSIPIRNPPEQFSAANPKRKRKRDSESDWGANFARLASGYYERIDRLEILNFRQSKLLSEIYKGEVTFPEGTQSSKTRNNIEKFISPFPTVARSLLIERNLKLVRILALRAARAYPSVDVEDLFQMGVLGLIRAVEKWEPARELQFSTYAVWWIRQAISRYAMDSAELIRIPIHHQEKMRRIKRLDEQNIDLDDEEDLEQVEQAEDLNVEEWREYERMFVGHESINELSYSSGELRVRYWQTLYDRDFEESPEVQLEFENLREVLQNVLDTLSVREAGVIMLRFGLVDGEPKTLDQIGLVYGVTRERIRQIEGKTMSKLRHPVRSQLLRDFLE